MRHIIIISILMNWVLMGCSASPSRDLIRNDLDGKPLGNDDFSLIVGNQVVKVFNSVDELKAVFPNAIKKENDTWQWSVLVEGRMHLKNTEYRAHGIRFVFRRENTNDYTGFSKGVITIRGVGIGDSARTVLEKYGKSYSGTEDIPGFFIEDSGLIYRFYNHPETANDVYPLFDYIHFETREGNVVGIHYWRKSSDAP